MFNKHITVHTLVVFSPHVISKDASHAFIEQPPEPKDALQLVLIQGLVNLWWQRKSITNIAHSIIITIFFFVILISFPCLSFFWLVCFYSFLAKIIKGVENLSPKNTNIQFINFQRQLFISSVHVWATYLWQRPDREKPNVKSFTINQTKPIEKSCQ